VIDSGYKIDAKMCQDCIKLLGRRNVFDLDDWNSKKAYLKENKYYDRLEECVDQLKEYGVW
jgi:hypothetical protein